MNESCCCLSLDMLRQELSRESPELLRVKTQDPVEPELPPTPGLSGNFNSDHSILHDPYTPGTEQSVCFFSYEAFKIITPNQSIITMDLDNKPQPAIPEEPTTLLD